MIGLPRGLTVFMYRDPVDMRKSFNTLSALVAHEMKRDLLEGDLFLFVGRDRKRAKVLYFDGKVSVPGRSRCLGLATARPRTRRMPGPRTK